MLVDTHRHPVIALMLVSIGSRNYLCNFLHTGHRDIENVSASSPDSGEVDPKVSLSASALNTA